MSDESGTTEQMIPLARLKAKNDVIAALEAKLKEAEDRAGAAEKASGDAEKWRTKYEAERTEHARTRSQGEEALTLVGAGITDAEDQEMIRYKHSRLPEDKRPSLADYLAGAAREDKHLAGLFRSETPAEAPPATKAPEAPKAAPSVRDNAGALPTPRPPTNDLEHLKSMTVEQWASERKSFAAANGFTVE